MLLGRPIFNGIYRRVYGHTPQRLDVPGWVWILFWLGSLKGVGGWFGGGAGGGGGDGGE